MVTGERSQKQRANSVTRCRHNYSLVVRAILALFILHTRLHSCGAKSYKWHKLIRSYPLDDKEADDIIEELSEWADEDHDAYKVWASPHKQHLDVAVHRDNMSYVVDMFESRRMPYEVLVGDLGRVIKKSEGSVCPEDGLPDHSDGSNEREPPAMSWCKFHRLSKERFEKSDINEIRSEIHKFLEDTAKRNDTTVDLQTIGNTYEGRNLTVLKINTADSGRIIWIDAGMHGREWIGPAVVTYMIKQLVDSYDDHKELVDAFEWYILPVANPDGYEYSHSEDRLWKKTRTNHGSSRGCRGVDPNRNFNFQWMVGSSRDKCSDNYGGPAPETENNVIAMRDKMLDMTRHGKVVAFLSFHSYAQVWATPWGWTSIPPRTAATLTRVANAAVVAIKKVYGTEYVAGSIADTLGISSGSSTGWAYGAAKIPFVFHVELRDEGVYGYALPPELILPTAVETFAGLKAALNEIREILDETKVITKTLNGIKTKAGPSGSNRAKDGSDNGGPPARPVESAVVDDDQELDVARKKRLACCGRVRRLKNRRKARKQRRRNKLKRKQQKLTLTSREEDDSRSGGRE